MDASGRAYYTDQEVKESLLIELSQLRPGGYNQMSAIVKHDGKGRKKKHSKHRD